MGLPFFNDLCSFVHKEATFFIDYILHIPVSYIIKLLFIYSFIFYTGPILIAVFITEMVILFKHVIIIIITIYYSGTSPCSHLCTTASFF